jgi:hypothetical protein
MVLILFCISKTDPAHPNVWLELLIAIGQALIIGPTISLILDLPSMVGYFKRITIESLISKEYLNSLPRQTLVDLRKECTAHIHLGDAPFVEQGLINIDENVCELLTQPYHERYRQNTTCWNEGNFTYKKHQVEELIINPLGNRTFKQPEMVKSLLMKQAGEQIDELFKVLKFSVTIDDQEERDYLLDLSIQESAADLELLNYNTQVVLQDKNGKPLFFEFNKSLKIERIYQVRVPKTDITFVKRLTMPAKSFRLDYHHSDPGCKLVGSCFGTLSFSNDGSLKVNHNENHISIEAYTWLLPGNGVIIVTV